jgi:hypothetical protein
MAGAELADGLPDALGVLSGGVGGDAALGHHGVERLVDLHRDQVEEPLVQRLDEGQPGGTRRNCFCPSTEDRNGSSGTDRTHASGPGR